MTDFPVSFISVVADIPRGSHERMRCSIEETRGRVSIRLREWFTADDGSLRPGRNGVAVRPDELESLIAALQTARLKLTGGGAL